MSRNKKLEEKLVSDSSPPTRGEVFSRNYYKFLTGEKDRECPSLRGIRKFKAKEEIMKAVEKETGKKAEDIKNEKGSRRQIVMDLLYRTGGLTGIEIGKILGVDYSTVSRGRKRLREKLKKDRKLKQLLNQIEINLSI